jgi:hypothetical protein
MPSAMCRRTAARCAHSVEVGQRDEVRRDSDRPRLSVARGVPPVSPRLGWNACRGAVRSPPPVPCIDEARSRCSALL